MTTTHDLYRALRREDPCYWSASLALSVARGAVRTRAEGLWQGHGWAGGHPVEIGGRTYLVRIHDDPDPADAYDDDVHGEVIDRSPYRTRHPEMEWGSGSGIDLADGETVIALDAHHAYRIDKAAESVTHLAGWRSRLYGMARGPARERALSELRDAGDRMLRATETGEHDVYGVSVALGDHVASLWNVELPSYTVAEAIASDAYLGDVVRDLADEALHMAREADEALARSTRHRVVITFDSDAPPDHIDRILGAAYAQIDDAGFYDEADHGNEVRVDTWAVTMEHAKLLPDPATVAGSCPGMSTSPSSSTWTAVTRATSSSGTREAPS